MGILSRRFTRTSSGSQSQVGDPQRQTRNKALLIGIQYHDSPETVPRLRVCHKDVHDFRSHLIRKWGYQSEDITVMLDTKGRTSSSDLYPSRENILAQIDKLVQNAQPGDQIVFYFAGHGYQLVSHDPKNEPDGYDEAILAADNNGLPYDERGNPLDPQNMSDEDRPKLDGLIVDNELHRRLVDALHPGAFLTSIFDSCHSGTLLDLPYYWVNRTKRTLSLPLPRKSSSKPVYPQSLNKRNSSRSSGGLSALNRSPPSRSSTQASTGSDTPWFDRALCMSPERRPVSIIPEEDEDKESCRASSTPQWSLRPQDRARERSFKPATLVLDASSPLDCPSGGSASDSIHPHVLCISPAQDHELTHDNEEMDNASFTATFITVMESSPHGLPLREFMERLRYTMFVGVTRWVTRVFKRENVAMDNLSQARKLAMDQWIANPQIGCTHPLDMSTTIELSRTRAATGNGVTPSRTRSLSVPVGSAA